MTGYVSRVATRCSATTRPWENTSTLTAHESTCVQSAAKHLWRAQSWRDTSWSTLGKSLSRFVCLAQWSLCSYLVLGVTIPASSLHQRAFSKWFHALEFSDFLLFVHLLFAFLFLSNSAIISLSSHHQACVALVHLMWFVFSDCVCVVSALLCICLCSVHLKAVENVFPWTSTCEHTWEFTQGTGRTCVHLTAATRSLPSPPTSSLTSSPTPRPS